MLAADEAHGAENKETMQAGWRPWTPVSVAAARTLQPIWSQPPEKAVQFEDSMARPRQRFRDLLDDFGLETPRS